MFRVDISNRAEKDMDTCISAGYGRKLAKIMNTVEEDPYKPSQGFERLREDLKALCSRRIDRNNRFVYSVLPNNEKAKDEFGNQYDGIVRVHEAWGHEYKKPAKQKHI